jgi:hypothetical protein
VAEQSSLHHGSQEAERDRDRETERERRRKRERRAERRDCLCYLAFLLTFRVGLPL